MNYRCRCGELVPVKDLTDHDRNCKKVKCANCEFYWSKTKLYRSQVVDPCYCKTRRASLQAAEAGNNQADIPHVEEQVNAQEQLVVDVAANVEPQAPAPPQPPQPPAPPAPPAPPHNGPEFRELQNADYTPSFAVVCILFIGQMFSSAKTEYADRIKGYETVFDVLVHGCSLATAVFLLIPKYWPPTIPPARRSVRQIVHVIAAQASQFTFWVFFLVTMLPCTPPFLSLIFPNVPLQAITWLIVVLLVFTQIPMRYGVSWTEKIRNGAQSMMVHLVGNIYSPVITYLGSIIVIAFIIYWLCPHLGFLDF